MNGKITIVFPLIAALGILLWFLRWREMRRNPLTAAEPESKSLLDSRDWACMLLITVLYGIIAFLGLGSTSAPQTFLHYEGAGYYAQLELAELQEISAIRYYSGLNTGEYLLQFSEDGENWTDVRDEDGNSGMTQEYTQLFRWNDANISEGLSSVNVKYVRIIAEAELWLGEIALYDGDGNLIPASAITLASGCEALMDEQDTVEETSSFRNGTYFDEIYHARTAYEHIQSVWPYEITHPPLGKLILGLGIRLFGMTPFGWRFSGMLVGVLMLPALYILLKKMFRETLVAVCGTLVFAFDFMHYTQTRLATIDSYVTFFILLMYLFLWFWLDERGPRRRWWLALSGVSFGLGAASKWTGFYAGAGLAVLWLLFWIHEFRKTRVVSAEDEAPAEEETTAENASPAENSGRKSVWQAFGKNILWCCLWFLLVPALIYYLSYYAYGTAQGMHGIGMFFRREYLQTVLDNQKYMWNYHSQLVATHPYSSRWYQWLLDVKPILYVLENYGDGTKSTFGAFSNPILCWGGLCAVIACGVLAVRERDNRAAFITLGYLANLLPWVPVSRLTFAYHYFPCTLFLALALSYVFADRIRHSYREGALACGGYTGACIAVFALFYPVLSGLRVSEVYTKLILKWIPDWPF